MHETDGSEGSGRQGRPGQGTRLVQGHVTLRQLQVYRTCCSRPGAGRRAPGGPGEAHTRRTQGAGGQGVLGLTLVLLLFSRHITSLRPHRL